MYTPVNITFQHNYIYLFTYLFTCMYTPVNGIDVPDLMVSKYSFIIIIIYRCQHILFTSFCLGVPD